VQFGVFARHQNAVYGFGRPAILKTSSPKPLKIPFFPLASGRQVDERLGISVDQLTRPVPFRRIPQKPANHPAPGFEIEPC
jgi:hypothetical protein